MVNVVVAGMEFNEVDVVVVAGGGAAEATVVDVDLDELDAV